MTHLSEIFDTNDLAHLLTEGYVRQQFHPTLDLRILNYTEKAQYESAWNDVTMACRGLITTSDGTVVARPFKKFWTIDQSDSPHVPDIPWGEHYQVYDKVDGSLGILYPTPDGAAIATRGSFASEQAIHATKIWRERYSHLDPIIIPVPPMTTPGVIGWTPLFEIIYPENRIVLDYDGMDDLVLLGAVCIADGRSVDAQTAAGWFAWTGPVAESYPAKELDAMLAEDRPNKEGYVLWFPESDFRIKMKHKTYLQLHRVITNANTKNVWKAWFEGNMDEIYALPDEFREGIDAYLKKLEAEYADLLGKLVALNAIREEENLAPGKATADWVIHYAQSPTIRAAQFCIINGKDYAPVLRKSLQPEQAEPLWGVTA